MEGRLGVASSVSGPKGRWRRRSRSTNQRPAEYVFSRNVAEKLDEIRKATPNPEGLDSGLGRGSLSCLAGEARQGADLAGFRTRSRARRDGRPRLV